MIDASRGYMKDGNKNRLRSQDIHKIVDVFNRRAELERYSRMVGFAEIEKNDFNLNIPRYIDSSEPEDVHDLDAHLNGGIPERDVEALKDYWEVFPTLRRTLFAPDERPGYVHPGVPAEKVRETIVDHPEFSDFDARVRGVFEGWTAAHDATLRGLEKGSDPKALLRGISEDLLERFAEAELVSHYDVYQHLMDYWHETMQDDVYAIAQDGWETGQVARAVHDSETPELFIKQGNKSVKYVGELIPANLIMERFFADEQAEVERLAAEAEAAAQEKAEFEEEHSTEEGVLDGLEGKSGIPKGNVQNRVMELKELALETIPMYTPEYEQIKEIKRSSFGSTPWNKGVQDDGELFAELDALHDYLGLVDTEAQTKKAHKEAAEALDKAVLSKYPELSEEEIKFLMVDNKWATDIERGVRVEIERIARTVASRVKALEERYAEPLPDLTAEVERLTEKVDGHLEEMGLAWNGRA